jgi:ferrochelatase
MTPFATKATVEGYKIAVEQSSKQAKSPLEVHYIPSWHTNPHYLEAVSAKVKEGLALFPPQRQPYIHLLFTAHSLPLAAVSNDSYAHEIRTTIEEVMKGFHDHDWSLAFQSQGKKGGEWLSPRVEDVLENMAKARVKEILVVPLGFCADHLEILYDLDIAVKEKAQNLGLVMHRSPSLNDSPTFVKALGDISLTVMDTLSS